MKAAFVRIRTDEGGLLPQRMKAVRRISSPAVAVLAVALFVMPARAEEWKQLLDLRGQWKFEIGDDMRRGDAAFNDAQWEQIFVPANWEDEGFPGYDGYAWYRKHFQAPAGWKEKSLSLHLGHVDDVDEVYLNGHLIGFSGAFPPAYTTAYDVNREYPIPAAMVMFGGENVIAVRVYDDQLGGGINSGKVGIFEDVSALRVDIPLPSMWKFTTGDNMEWKEPGFDDNRWKSIAVPAWWETQGFRNYDGFGWYRTTFVVPAPLQQERLIAVVGMIDDLDEVYLNGERIGKTGHISANRDRISFSDEYQEMRAYTIPPELLSPGKKNVLAVRVYDGFKDGGIYQGPVGIVTRERYRAWAEDRQKNNKDTEKKGWNFFDFFLK